MPAARRHLQSFLSARGGKGRKKVFTLRSVASYTSLKIGVNCIFILKIICNEGSQPCKVWNSAEARKDAYSGLTISVCLEEQTLHVAPKRQTRRASKLPVLLASRWCETSISSHRSISAIIDAYARRQGPRMRNTPSGQASSHEDPRIRTASEGIFGPRNRQYPVLLPQLPFEAFNKLYPSLSIM